MTTEGAASAWTWHTYRTNGQEFAQVKAGEAVYNVVPEHAPLIAAAPDLLAAAQGLLSLYDEDEYPALRAAVAKATTDERGRPS